jgi:hypothetical protein
VFLLQRPEGGVQLHHIYTCATRALHPVCHISQAFFTPHQISVNSAKCTVLVLHFLQGCYHWLLARALPAVLPLPLCTRTRSSRAPAVLAAVPCAGMHQAPRHVSNATEAASCSLCVNIVWPWPAVWLFSSSTWLQQKQVGAAAIVQRAAAAACFSCRRACLSAPRLRDNILLQ